MAGLRTLVKPDEAVSLWAISVDSPDQNKAFAASIAEDGAGKLAIPLLADSGHRVIDAYGIKDPRYARLRREGIPYPAVYVIDRSGRVAWARIEEDYTQRPSNREIRAALDALIP